MNSSFPRSRLGVIKPHEQGAVIGVPGRIQRGQLVAHGELVPVLLDEGADVVALQRDREPGNGPVTEVHEEKVSASLYTGDHLVVPGDHHHIVVGLRRHRALRPEGLEIGIGVDKQVVISEEVDCVELAHWAHRSLWLCGDVVQGDRPSGRAAFGPPDGPGGGDRGCHPHPLRPPTAMAATPKNQSGQPHLCK